MTKIPIYSGTGRPASGEGGKPVEDENHAAPPEAPEAAEAPPEPPREESEAEKLKKQADEYLDMLRRVQADFENYKKRVKREKVETIAYANESMARKLLSVVDNLERGIDCARAGSGGADDLISGIELVVKQFTDILGEYNVHAFDSVGKPFDPTRHECLYVKPCDDVPDQTVVEEMEKGYTMHERVLRVAKVAVSRKPEPPPAAEA